MMKKRSKLLAVVTCAVLAAKSTVLIADTPARHAAESRDVRGSDAEKPTVATAKQMREWSPIPPPALLAPPDPFTVYTVAPIPVRGVIPPRTHQQDRDLETASAIISRERPIPAERARFFDWMNANDSSVTFAGWGIFVEKAIPVTPVRGGWLITIRSHAFATLKSGGPASVNNVFTEEYLWADGKLRFLRGYAEPRIGREPSISLF
jgi:hypothetical protein